MRENKEKPIDRTREERINSDEGRDRKVGVIDKHDGETLIISLTDSINSDSIKRISGRIDDLLLTGKPSRVIMDMSQVSYIDNSGFWFLFGRSMQADKIGCRLIIRSPSPQVMDFLDISGARRFLEIENYVGDELGEK